MKRFVLVFALAVGLLVSATTMAQVNMSRYITLTVTNGAAIKLNFRAAAATTPIRIVSGSNTQDIIVGTDWYNGNTPSTFTVTAQDTEMKVYGDIVGFNCYGNGANLTALDPSHNTQLEKLDCGINTLSSLDVSKNTQLTGLWCGDNNLSNLDVSHNTQLTLLNCRDNKLSNLDISHNTQLTGLYCHGNNFTTAALDDIYCALPVRQASDNARIQPVYDSSSSNYATVLATNKQNAIDKNWKVQYWQNDTDIPATTGNYVCGTPHLDTYITLTVTNGAAIKLDFKAAAAATPVRIVSGSNTQNITVGTNWTGITSYTAAASTMTIYGNLIGFDCSKNGVNLTALDPSHNTQLTSLYCSYNTLTSLDVSKNTQLTRLYCFSNTLSSLDVSHNTQLKELHCYRNQLASLDVSNNTQLTELYCHGNNFTTAALDDIFCALPDRTGKENGVIEPVYSDTSSNHAIVLATNKANAIAKNWKVQYYADDTDIPATTGSYVCPQLNMSSYITLTVTSGAAIKLDFKAVADGTPVRIVSGSNTQDITVGTDWKGTASYTADGTEMKVYGNLTGFNCSKNGANLTALDPSHNTQLTRLWCGDNNLSNLDVSKNTQLAWLYCYSNKLSSLDLSKNTQLRGLFCHGNNFSTAALDDIFCALPVRQASDDARIQPVYSDTSSNHAIVLATNKANAIAKNWKVQYWKDNTDIPATTGSYVCPQLNMSSYITLTVKKDSAISLYFKAAATGTPVRIVSGSNTQDITVGTDWTGFISYTADGTTMIVYGDITDFDCSENGVNLTALDASHNTQLTELYCNNNTLTSLNVSKNTQLTRLGCSNNRLSNLDVSHNTQLTGLGCSNNRLSNLDVSHNTQLTELYCGENTLSSLDVTKNTQLTKLDCSSNTLTSLDVTKNTQLTKLDCYSNTLTSLDVSKNTQLTKLDCYSNTLSSLDVSQNTQLTRLGCSNNRLSNLDVSHNTQLTSLSCSNNRFSNLDVSHNTQLTRLYCHGNNFTTAALDDIFCALPDKTGKGNGVIEPVYSDTSSNHAIVLATNKANAIAKNWKVQYYKNDTDIPATTGSYECGTPHTDIAEATAEPQLTLYPNPVADVLYLSATARTIRIYNVYGIEVAHATDTDRVEVSHLPAGVYTVRADGTVAKMVKR